VTDWAALVASMVDHPDVQAAAEKAANAAIRAAKGVIKIPGVEVETVESLV
jgi:glucose-6-phosphate dehydrogenase assembly protein OpcA